MVTLYPIKKYPFIGVCGLDCGLCIRYHTDGKSRCPGCCGPDFFEKHPSCCFISCAVKNRGLETCAQCPDWQECEHIFQLRQASLTHDSFISYRPVMSNFAYICKYGVNKFIQREIEKQKVLIELLNNFDDGRAKLFYCTACQLINPEEITRVIHDVNMSLPPSADIKEKARTMRSALIKLAQRLKIDLVLRK